MKREWWALRNLIVITMAIVLLGLFGGCPRPKPDPDPDPQPIPALAVVVVEERTDRTAQQGIVLAGLQNYLTAEGIGWQYADKDMKDGATDKPAVWLAPYLVIVKDSGLPLPVLIVEGEAFKLPGTIEGAVELVKKEVK